MNGLFTEVWAGKETISVDHAVEITLPVWVFLRLSNLSPIIFSHANILNLRLLSLSLVLQVISVFCFFFATMLIYDKDSAKKCHGTRIKPYQRDTGCRWKTHFIWSQRELPSKLCSQTGVWNLRSIHKTSRLLMMNYRYRDCTHLWKGH